MYVIDVYVFILYVMASTGAKRNPKNFCIKKRKRNEKNEEKNS